MSQDEIKLLIKPWLSSGPRLLMFPIPLPLEWTQQSPSFSWTFCALLEVQPHCQTGRQLWDWAADSCEPWSSRPGPAQGSGKVLFHMAWSFLCC